MEDVHRKPKDLTEFILTAKNEHLKQQPISVRLEQVGHFNRRKDNTVGSKETKKSPVKEAILSGTFTQSKSGNKAQENSKFFILKNCISSSILPTGWEGDGRQLIYSNKMMDFNLSY